MFEGIRSRGYARLQSVEGLVRVLMKARNGEPWTEDDRTFLWTELRRVGSSRLLFLLHMLGSHRFLLPLLAWFFDRRRKKGARPHEGGRRRSDFVGGAVG